MIEVVHSIVYCCSPIMIVVLLIVPSVVDIIITTITTSIVIVIGSMSMSMVVYSTVIIILVDSNLIIVNLIKYYYSIIISFNKIISVVYQSVPIIIEFHLDLLYFLSISSSFLSSFAFVICLMVGLVVHIPIVSNLYLHHLSIFVSSC